MSVKDLDQDPMAPGRVSHYRDDDGEHQPELSRLRAELNKTLTQTMRRTQTGESKPYLKVKACTVELGITWTLEGDADVRFWILDFTGKATREDAQTITIDLEPAGTSGPEMTAAK